MSWERELSPFIGPTGKSVMEDSPSHGTPSHRRDRKMTRQNTIDGASNTELALAQTRIWIEECTGCVQEEKGYREFLQDGTLLCKLIQAIQPGLIKKINRVRSPFAWRENLSFFLEACQKLGLKGSQLFSPEDLQPGTQSPLYKSRSAGRGERERRLRNVAVTLFWLSRAVQALPSYSGPVLHLDCSTLGELDSLVKSPGPLSPSPQTRSRSFSSPESTTGSDLDTSSSIDKDQRTTKDSPTAKEVQSVVTHTSDTEKQSVSHIVLYLGNKSHNTHSPVTRSKSEDIQPTEANDPVSSEGEVVRERADSCSEGVLVEEESIAILQTFLSQEHSLLNGRENSLSDSHSRESTTSPSEVSTVILREQPTSSRCSRSILGSESSHKSGLSETDSVFNGSPAGKHHNSDPDIEAPDFVFSPDTDTLAPPSAALPEAQEAPTDSSTLPPPPQFSESPSIAEVNGTDSLPLDFKGDLESWSQESSSACCSSPHEEDSTALHFSLTQSHHEHLSQQSTDSPTTPRKSQTDSVLKSATVHTNFTGEIPKTELKKSIILLQEETVDGSLSSPADLKVSFTDSTSGSILSGRAFAESLCEEVFDSPSVTLKESPLQSRPSSTCSCESSNSSSIVVKYSDQSLQEDKSTLSPPADVSYNSSFNGDENLENSIVSLKTKQKQRNSEVLKVRPQTHTDNLDRTESVDMAGILTVYPSPSNRVNMVPHHSLNVQTMTGLDSPSLQKSAVKSRTLQVIPSATTSSSLPNSHPPIPTPTSTSSKATPTSCHDDEEVQVILLPGEKWLGFNIVGGRDHGTPLTVGSIAGDSPAARTSLKCGDELLAVNGQSLQDVTHSEATKILHKAVSKDKIILKINRSLSDSSAHPQKTYGDHQNTAQSPTDPAVLRLSKGSGSSSNREQQPHPAVSSLKVQAIDISRVCSDALPRTMHAKMIVYEGSLEESGAAKPAAGHEMPDFLSDITSTAVEVGSSVDDSEKLSMTDSHQSTSSIFNETGSQGELHSEHISADEPTANGHLSSTGITDNVSASTSILNTIMEIARKHSSTQLDGGRQSETKEGRTTHKSTRPISAPIRSSPSSGSCTLPSSLTQTELRKFREKRISLDEERQKRRANIKESARAALQYSRHRKSESLPRQYSSPLSKSLGSEEEFHSLHNRKSSSPAVVPGGTSPVKVAPESSPVHLNLRILSMDETLEASFNQMDEIWRQVESGSDDVPSLTELGGSLDSRTNGRQDSPVMRPTHTSSLSTSSGSGKVSDQSWSKDVQEDDHVSPVRTNITVDTTSPQEGVSSHAESSDHEVVAESDVEVTLDETLEAAPPLFHSTPMHSAPAATLNGILLETSQTEEPSVSVKAIDSLLESLRSLNEKVGTYGEEEEFRMLEEMLRSNTFKKAKEFHDRMRNLLAGAAGAPKPVVKRAVSVSHLVRQHLHHHTEPSPNVDELRALLRHPHVQALMFCHDRVATCDFYISAKKFHRTTQDAADLILSPSVSNFNPSEHPSSTSTPLSRDVPTTRKENATIVFLERSNRPLGCTIYKHEDAVFIGKLLKGCDAEQSEVLREGDELLEVNGIPVIGRSTDEIVRLMSADPATPLALTIIPVHDDNMDLEYEAKYVRAHFNYNGRLDDEIPCKALALSFQRGDIVEISNQDDPDWWQARKIFDDGAESLPGLIPARHLQQKREALIQSYPSHPYADQRKGLRSMFSRKKKKKIYYQQVPPASVLGIGDEVPTYEDVVKLEPNPELRRPIVLIGAPGVGRRTLIRKLLNSDTSHFAPVVQHTTRPIRSGEVNSHDYFFITREEFEQEVQQDRFLEYGELRGHYYGTSYSSVKRVQEAGKVPVLDLNPQALKTVRYSGLMPYVVFIASPQLERLHITRKVGSEKQKKRLVPASSQADLDDAQVYTETELHHLVKESRQIEAQYGHYFDWIIMNDDFQVAADMLKEVARRLEDEPQWVPACWMQEI